MLTLHTEMNTDHINGDGLDNRRENLRICTTLKNCQNRQKQRQTSSSVFKGVSWYPNRKKWVAYIKVNGIQLHLGYFTSEYNAAVCYNLAAKKYFGEFALTNLKLFREKYGREIVEL